MQIVKSSVLFLACFLEFEQQFSRKKCCNDLHGGLTLKLRTSKFFPYYQHTRVRLRVSRLSNCCAKGKVFFAMWTIQPEDYSSLSRQTNSFSQKVLLLLGCHRRTLIRRCYRTNLNGLGLRPRGHHFHSSSGTV